jgi:hypothetical protein
MFVHCKFLQELGHHQTSGTSTDQESVGTGLGGNLLETVHGARSGLDESGVDVADVVDLEELALGVVALETRRKYVTNSHGIMERLTYSAKPPSKFRTPWAEKSSQRRASPLRQ